MEVEFKRRRGSDDVIEAITFIKGGVRFKGSQIGRQFSYAKLNERLANNEPRQTANLERIEEKFFDERSGKAERDKLPVQTEQGKSEGNRNLAEAIMPLVDSMNRTNRNLCVLRDALKIISERQKESRKELLDTIGSKLEALSAKNDEATAEEIHALRQL